MKKYGITTREKLQGLCLNNDWLNGVTYDQFSKIFKANEECCTIDTMALLIWVCSPGVDIMSIKESLTQAHKEYEISEEC